MLSIEILLIFDICVNCRRLVLKVVSRGKFPEDVLSQGVPTLETVKRCLKDGPRGIDRFMLRIRKSKGSYFLVGRGGAEKKSFSPREGS